MSWKVYEGIRINGISSLEDAKVFIDSLRQPITDILHEEISTQVKHLACLIYDMHHSFDVDMFDASDKSRMPLLAATMRIMGESRNEDTGYTISLSMVDGITVGIPYFQGNRKCLEHLIGLPNVEAFGYWDNTDPDSNVSKKEWKLRKDVWVKVFEHHPAPINAMFSMQIADTHGMIPNDSHMLDVPDMQSREDMCAHHFSVLQASKPIEEGGGWDGDHFSGIMNKINELKPEMTLKVAGKLSKLTMGKLEKDIPLKETKDGS